MDLLLFSWLQLLILVRLAVKLFALADAKELARMTSRMAWRGFKKLAALWLMVVLVDNTNPE